MGNILDVATGDRHLRVTTDDERQRIFLTLVLAGGRNWTTVMSLEEAKSLVELLQQHIECAERGHDALPEAKHDPFTGASRMKVCRRCGDEWPSG